MHRFYFLSDLKYLWVKGEKRYSKPMNKKQAGGAFEKSENTQTSKKSAEIWKDTTYLPKEHPPRGH